MEKLHLLIHKAVKRWADKHKTGQAADAHTEAAKGKHEEKQPEPKAAGHETIIAPARDGQNIKKRAGKNRHAIYLYVITC